MKVRDPLPDEQDLSKSGDLRVCLSHVDPEAPVWKQHLVAAVEAVLCRGRFQKLYDDYKTSGDRYDSPLSAFFDLADISLQYDKAMLDSIPKSGPTIIVANHPLGAVDGMALLHLCRMVRDDVRIVAHRLVTRIPELRDLTFPVENSNDERFLALNIRTRGLTTDHLKKGGLLIVFPGGGVGTAPDIIGDAHCKPWTRYTGKLIHQHKTAVVPVYFDAQNSRFFQLASRFSMAMKSALLASETRWRMGKPLRIVIGKAIPYSTMAPITSRDELVTYLRDATYGLVNRHSPNDTLVPYLRPLTSRIADVLQFSSDVRS